jgi:hypothetical protein
MKVAIITGPVPGSSLELGELVCITRSLRNDAVLAINTDSEYTFGEKLWGSEYWLVDGDYEILGDL